MPYRRKDTNVIWITINGVRQSSRTDDWEAAKALEHKLNYEYWRYSKLGAPLARSWKELCVKWCADKSTKVTADEDISKIRVLDTELSGVSDIGGITRERVDRILSRRPGVSATVQTPANSTANRFVALISAMLRYAEFTLEWGNRAPKLRTYPEPREEQRWLTVQEWLKLSNVLPTHLRLVATFSLSTGLREAKVFGLKWSHLDIKNRSLAFTGTANKIGACIPMNATAMGILMECKSAPVVSPEYVFLYAGHRMQCHKNETWGNAFKRAGVPYMKWHGLRHTFISWLAQEGVPEEIRKRLAGHSTQKRDVHAKYTHYEIEHLRPYSEVIDRILNEQVPSVSLSDTRN